MITEILKPSSPSLKWDNTASFWDEEDMAWDGAGYPDIDKPVMKTYILTQSGDYLVFQEGSKINIGGSNYSEVTRPPVPVYTTINKPL